MARGSWLVVLLLVAPACAPDGPADPPESGAQEPTTVTKVLVIADDGIRTEAREAVAPSRLAGWYYTGMLGYSLDLRLRADGSFHLEEGGCLGVYGTAAGQWYVDPDGLALIPAQADGVLAGHPAHRLSVARRGGLYLLVQEKYWDRAVESKPWGIACLYPEAVWAASRRYRANDPGRPAGPAGGPVAAEPSAAPDRADGK